MDYRIKMLGYAVFGNIPYGEIPYQWLQKKIGGLKNPDFKARFQRNALLISALAAKGFKFSSARIMEIGTGRIPTSPVGFYLVWG
ncbi:MAG: hypothetical protein HY752_00290 [Nitrospirae bacterium]|nr:hypothetical protein [Nitrospirota bacterium]